MINRKKTILSLSEEVYKIKELIAENVWLVQTIDDVNDFNRELGHDYNYYYIFSVDGHASMLFGSYTVLLSDNAYFVKRL